MALTSSGQISLNDVNVELGLSGTAQISLNDSAVRGLFEISSGEIEMADGYGKADFSPWTTTPTFQNFKGTYVGTTVNGTYTPTAGTVKFLVMMWGSVGHGGNSTDYSNLPPIGVSGANGAAYSERLYTHSGNTTYNYTLGSQANYQATSGSPTRHYAGTTYFYGTGATMSCTGTGNPGGGGAASGGTFNANGGGGGNSTGGGGGSRTGAGQSNGSNGGTSVASGAVNINFMGWRGFDWSSSWGESSDRGSSGRGKYHPRSGDVYGGTALTSMETAFAAVHKYAQAGAPKSNVSNGTRGDQSQIVILEYHSGDSDGT